NVNFGKSNFTGYNFQIRGIGNKLVSATGDSGTGIHLNNVPLIQNNLFETEFYDMERVEVLRGPQGTLYGRNATGGVVNILTAKPVDNFQASIRGEYGNYDSMKLRGMINVPVNDMVAVRAAATYLKRDGFGTNIATGNDADNRDLWGGRLTVSFTPSDRLRTWAMWDHFEGDDNRSRIGKQFCSKDPGPASIGGVAYSNVPELAQIQRGLFSVGCRPVSLYAPDVLGTVNSQGTIFGLFGTLLGFQTGDAYVGKTQTPNIRDIESFSDPIYKSKQDTWEFNAAFDLTDNISLNWLSAYTIYKLYTRQDYNRYTPSTNLNTTPNACNFFTAPCSPLPPQLQAPVAAYQGAYGLLFPGGVINDPQLGPLNSIATSDISSLNSDQWSQEIRFQSSFDGPLNFNLGAFYTKLTKSEDYYVMLNTGTAFAQVQNLFNTGNPNCLGEAPCISVDPNKDPTNRLGHNYYDNYNPYRLTSYAAFGELYWQMAENFKWTAGLRYTVDKKEFGNHRLTFPEPGVGIGPPPPGTPDEINVTFKKPTGRFGFDWKPELGFTNDTLVYAFYSRGYKAGGINPAYSPGIGLEPVPATFKPELVDSFEVGTKNTLLDGTLQVNLAAFHYGYKGYQIARIINRNAANENIDAKVMGAEFESIWQPIQGLRLNAAIGWLDTKIDKNQHKLDSFNRTQGNPNLIVLKTEKAANCVVTVADAQAALAVSNATTPFLLLGLCTPVSEAGRGTNILGSGAIASGTNALGGINGISGLVTEGVEADLGGNELPNSPHWTVSLGAQYSWTLGDWDATLRGDYYHQTKTFARIYNSTPDRIKAWDNVNLTLTVENSDLGVEVAGFVKNATNEKAITDTYLTDDSSGLFQNVFYTDPRTYGVSVTKRW
ncbi:MAG TPA: TonB-dependent receptor, partial [Phenylobacterium sp.]